MNKEQKNQWIQELERKKSVYAGNHYMAMTEDFVNKMRDTIQSVADKNGMPFNQVKHEFIMFMFRGYTSQQQNKLKEAIRSCVKPLVKPFTLTVTHNH